MRWMLRTPWRDVVLLPRRSGGGRGAASSTINKGSLLWCQTCAECRRWCKILMAWTRARSLPAAGGWRWTRRLPSRRRFDGRLWDCGSSTPVLPGGLAGIWSANGACPLTELDASTVGSITTSDLRPQSTFRVLFSSIRQRERLHLPASLLLLLKASFRCRLGLYTTTAPLPSAPPPCCLLQLETLFSRFTRRPLIPLFQTGRPAIS